MQCNSCSKELKTENDQKREICFGCHVKGIRFGFRGAEIGQSSWNNTTIREVQRSYEESDAFKQGKIEKVPDRKELI